MNWSRYSRHRLVAAAVCATAALPVAAQTDAATASQDNGRQLGLADSQARFCARHDPSGAEAPRARVLQIEQRVGTDGAAALRGGTAYRAAFDAETTFLERVDDRNASRVCEGRADRRKSG
jgi:hypothetical protein